MNAIIGQYVERAKSVDAATESLNDLAARTVAVLFLSATLDEPVKTLKRSSNAEVKSALTEMQWKREKVRLSHAWTACEYFGEAVALDWANGDNSLALETAYKLVPRNGKASKSDIERLYDLMVKCGEETTLHICERATTAWEQQKVALAEFNASKAAALQAVADAKMIAAVTA